MLIGHRVFRPRYEVEAVQIAACALGGAALKDRNQAEVREILNEVPHVAIRKLGVGGDHQLAGPCVTPLIARLGEAKQNGFLGWRSGLAPTCPG